MLKINLEKIASVRLEITCKRFLNTAENEICIEDFIRYAEAAYNGKVRNAGKKTAAEAAYIICYAYSGDTATTEQLICSCYELLSHRLNDSDAWSISEADFWKYAREAAKTFEKETANY